MKIITHEYIYGVREDGIQTVSDFMLPFVMLHNDSDAPVELQELCFAVNGPDGRIAQKSLTAEMLPLRFQAAIEEWQLYRPATWERTLGLTETVSLEGFATQAVLQPGQRAVVHQEFFRVHDAQEAREVVVETLWDGGKVSQKIQVALNPQKNTYSFPIRKPCYATGAYIDPDAHRWCRNSEFAIDIGLPGPDGRLDTNAILGEPVYAVADGTILQAFGAVKEDETDPELLEARYGNDVRIDGNHVIIEHPEGECSLYAHLHHLARDWQPGDRINHGELLGYVGSTGHSACPHLHFHMFKKDGDFGPSIPVVFQDITDIYGDPMGRVIRDDMLVFPQEKRD